MYRFLELCHIQAHLPRYQMHCFRGSQRQALGVPRAQEGNVVLLESIHALSPCRLCRPEGAQRGCIVALLPPLVY
mgnify:CR=1 FL=1